MKHPKCSEDDRLRSNMTQERTRIGKGKHVVVRLQDAALSTRRHHVIAWHVCILQICLFLLYIEKDRK